MEMRLTGDMPGEKISAEGHTSGYLAVAIHDENCPHYGACEDPEDKGCHVKGFTCEYISLGFETRRWLRKAMDVFETK